MNSVNCIINEIFDLHLQINNKGLCCLENLNPFPLLLHSFHSLTFSRSKMVLQIYQDIASQWGHVLKVTTRITPFYSDHLSIDFFFFFLPVQRKSGMSEALYGQNDVISSSYGAERKLCFVEARPGHLAHMWHSQNTFSTKISTLQDRTLRSTLQISPFRYAKRMPVVPAMCAVLFMLVNIWTLACKSVWIHQWDVSVLYLQSCMEQKCIAYHI